MSLEIPITAISVHEYELPNENDCYDINKIKKYLIKKKIWDKINIGDLIVNTKLSGYRMHGVHIICSNDNNKYIDNLSDYPDDYGTIPEQFITPLYNPNVYFRTGNNNFNWHNCLVPVDISKFIFLDEEIILNKNTFWIGYYYNYKYAFSIGDMQYDKFKEITSITYFNCIDENNSNEKINFFLYMY